MSLNITHGLRRSLLLATAALLLAAGGAQAQGKSGHPRVKLATSAGDIVLELYPDKAPRTVENFLQYVKDKHYDGTVFHRVIDGFMIQGGDPLGTGTGGFRWMSPNRKSGNFWLIGASLNTSAYSVDGFKLNNLAVVPEPATWLMMIAGFQDVTSGDIRLAGRSIAAVPPEKP